MPRGWTSEQETAEMRARWRTLTVDEIRSHKKEAAEAIAVALQNLYLATGIEFEIKSKLSAANELNAETRWIARYHFDIHLVGHI